MKIKIIEEGKNIGGEKCYKIRIQDAKWIAEKLNKHYWGNKDVEKLERHVNMISPNDIWFSKGFLLKLNELWKKRPLVG